MPQLAGDGPGPANSAPDAEADIRGNPSLNEAVEAGVFEPEDVACLRSSLDHAWNSLPPEHRTSANMDILAAEIVRVAMHSERDPVRLSAQALKAVMPEVPHGTL
jgi:hypothetical protein